MMFLLFQSGDKEKARELRNAAILRVQQRSQEHDEQKKEEKRERDQHALKEQMKVCSVPRMFTTEIKHYNVLRSVHT